MTSLRPSVILPSGKAGAAGAATPLTGVPPCGPAVCLVSHRTPPRPRREGGCRGEGLYRGGASAWRRPTGAGSSTTRGLVTPCTRGAASCVRRVTLHGTMCPAPAQRGSVVTPTLSLVARFASGPHGAPEQATPHGGAAGAPLERMRTTGRVHAPAILHTAPACHRFFSPSHVRLPRMREAMATAR